jgi:hypothetical protein
MLLLGILGWVAQAVATTPTNPNILFIAADALRPQPGGSGEKQIVSPNLASAPALNSSAPIEGVTVETGGEKLEAIVETPAVVVAGIYRLRWQIELFFRWIKGHLRIKHFFGNSPNAVKTQIWIAVTTYLLVAIIHKQLRLPGSLHRTLQLLSVHPFEKMPLHELLTKTEFTDLFTQNPNQLQLFAL